MMKYYKNENRKILLLASNKDDLHFMQNALLSVKPRLEDRITGASDCEKALKELVRSNFPIKFICPQEGSEECVVKYIYNLFLKNSKSHSLNVELVEEFYLDIFHVPLIIFNYKKRIVQIRKKYLKNKAILNRIVNTLFDTPPVYISYGNDNETKTLLNEIGKKFSLLFPHIKIKYDKKDVSYKKSISAYIENLALGKNIILMINRKYLESEYCMGEFIYILKNSKKIHELKQKIYPIVTESGKCIYDTVEIQKILGFWDKKRTRVLDAMMSGSNTALSAQLDLIDQIIKSLPDITEAIQDFYTLGLETYRESNFFDLFWEINTQLTKDGFISFYSNEDEMKKALGLTD